MHPNPHSLESEVTPVLVGPNIETKVLPLTSNVSNGLLNGKLFASSSRDLSYNFRKLIQSNLNNLLKSEFITYTVPTRRFLVKLAIHTHMYYHGWCVVLGA